MKRKLLCLLLVICMFVVNMTMASASLSTDSNSKLSEDVLDELEKMGDTDKIEVYVIMNDIDSENVMEVFSEKYPSEYETYMRAKANHLDSDVLPVVYGDVDLKDGQEGPSLIGNSIDDNMLQKAIELKRATFKEHYDEHNANALGRYCDKEQQIFVSSYAPLAILNVTKDAVLEMAKDNTILSITKFVEQQTIQEDLGLANQITRADYVRDSYNNKGSGVKIGIVEASGIPNTSNSYLDSATIITRSGDTTIDSHATNVAKILVGTDENGTDDGLAPNATLYACTAGSTSEFYVAVEWLISSGVNVINASLGIGRTGTYDTVSAWVDHIAVQHDIHFVKSAGNEGGNITSPGMAYNAITVGGLDDNGSDSVSGFSMYTDTSYIEAANCAEKPNLVAPAVDIWNSSGTSYAAPQVAGTIAQLCSYNSSLKTKQAAMGAILAASSAEKVEAVGTGAKGDSFITSRRVDSNPQISDKEGAGILDSRWARGIVYYGNYWSYTINEDSFPYDKYVQINASENSVTRVAIFWLKRNTATSHTSGSVSQVAMTDLDISVYDPNGNLIGSSTTSESNFEIVQFSPTISGSYRIRINAYGCDEKDHVGIAVW